MRMVSRTYVIRSIDPVDRAKNGRQVENAELRGDLDEVQIIKDSFAQWEKDQGQERERLVCAVCGSIWLAPTSRGTARPHRRDDVEQPTWDKVRLLRKEIQVLQAELDRVLEALEP
jgi:hypothetical protein